jgi:hypothetical protein
MSTIAQHTDEPVQEIEFSIGDKVFPGEAWSGRLDCSDAFIHGLAEIFVSKLARATVTDKVRGHDGAYDYQLCWELAPGIVIYKRGFKAEHLHLAMPRA